MYMYVHVCTSIQCTLYMYMYRYSKYTCICICTHILSIYMYIFYIIVTVQSVDHMSFYRTKQALRMSISVQNEQALSRMHSILRSGSSFLGRLHRKAGQEINTQKNMTNYTSIIVHVYMYPVAYTVDYAWMCPTLSHSLH